MQRLALRIFAVTIITLAAAPVATPQAAHVDREGFPLPAEAVARIGSARLRHLGIVHGVAYSRDGKEIISIGEDDRICVWDADTGRLLRWSEAKLGSRFPLAVRMDDRVVDVATNGFLCSFDAHTGKVLHRILLNETRYARQGCFSRDGRWFAFDDSVVNIAGLAAGKPNARRQLGTYPAAQCLAFTPERNLLAVGGADATSAVKFIDPATGQSAARSELPAQGPCWIAPDGRCLIAESIWDKTGKHAVTLQLDKNHLPFGSVAFSPDSRLVAVPDWFDVALYETATGKELRRLPTGPHGSWRPNMPIVGRVKHPLTFSPDGKRLVVGNHDGQISQWDVATGKPLCSAEPFAGSLRVRRFIDGNRVLAETDGLVLYDRKTGELVRRYPWESEAFVRSVVRLAPDGKMLAVPQKDGKLELRDAQTGKALRTLSGDLQFTSALAFAPDGKRLYSGGGMFPNIRIWDLASGKMLREIEGLSGRFSGSRSTPAAEYIAVAPDSRLFATAANQPTMDDGAKWSHWLRVWDAASGALLYKQGFELPLSQHSTFAPTGELLVVQDGAGIRKIDVLSLIDPVSGKQRWTLQLTGKLDLKQTYLTSVAFSADGRNLAVGGYDGTLALYETATGRRRHAFHGHARAVDGLAFTPDGALLAASSADAPVFLWDVYGVHGTRLPAWDGAVAAGIWKALADADAERAFDTIRRLVHHPQAAVGLLRDRLQARADVLEKQFHKLLRELDSDDFEARQRAYGELGQRANEFEFHLRRTATSGLPLEVKRRLEPILAQLDLANPDRVRRLRAMEALRQIATPEAHRLLRSLGGIVPTSPPPTPAPAGSPPASAPGSQPAQPADTPPAPSRR